MSHSNLNRSTHGDVHLGDVDRDELAMDDELDAGEAEALARLVDELRTATPPALDWGRVEERVMRRTELEAAALRRPAALRPAAPSWGALSAFAAAAAAVVMLIAGTAQKDVAEVTIPEARPAVDVQTLPTVAQEEGSLPRYRVDGLAPGSVIVSGAEPVQLSLVGVATWTLGAHSRAVVRTTEAAPHVVELLSGSLFAEVVPQHSANEIVEAFVVEAGGARVAVHGTVFSVVRVGDRVDVEVTRGTVTVGPSSYRGATTGHLLVSPARASFDAGTGAFIERLPFVQHDEAVAAAHDSSREPAADPSRAAGPAHTPPESSTASADKPTATSMRPPSSASLAENAPPEPAASSVEEPVAPPPLTLAQARALVMGCLSSQGKLGESAETLVTISSQVTAVLGGDGSVDAVRFSPPLKPALQSVCGGALFGRKIQGAGSVSFGVTFRSQ